MYIFLLFLSYSFQSSLSFICFWVFFYCHINKSHCFVYYFCFIGSVTVYRLAYTQHKRKTSCPLNTEIEHVRLYSVSLSEHFSHGELWFVPGCVQISKSYRDECSYCCLVTFLEVKMCWQVPCFSNTCRECS